MSTTKTTDVQPSPFDLPPYSRERRLAHHGKREGTTAAREFLPTLLDLSRDPDEALAELGWVLDSTATLPYSGPAIYAQQGSAYIGHLTSTDGDGGRTPDTFVILLDGGEVAKAYAPLPESRQGSTL